MSSTPRYQALWLLLLLSPVLPVEYLGWCALDRERHHGGGSVA